MRDRSPVPPSREAPGNGRVLWSDPPTRATRAGGDQRMTSRTTFRFAARIPVDGGNEVAVGDLFSAAAVRTKSPVFGNNCSPSCSPTFCWRTRSHIQRRQDNCRLPQVPVGDSRRPREQTAYNWAWWKLQNGSAPESGLGSCPI